MSTPSAKVTVNVKVYEWINSNIRQGRLTAEVLDNIELANGTTDGTMCDKVYSVTETAKAASTTFSYDLASGSLVDIDGATVTFAEVCCIFVANRRTTAAAYISVGPHASNGFGIVASGKGFWNAALGSGGGNNLSPAISAPNSESTGKCWLCLYDPTGAPVVAGTGDVLAIVTSAVAGATNSWDLIIIGRSA